MVESPDEPQLLAPGLWRWERRHPEWHPGAFGAVVGSYLARAEGQTILVDPLCRGEEDPLLPALDALVAGPVSILVTIPYHTRSAEFLQRRYASHGAVIRGHPLVARRLSDTDGFRSVEPGDSVGPARFHAIGRPRRAEMPIELPSLDALFFGDSVVEVDGVLRVWEAPLTSDRRRQWYQERFLPTLRHLLDLEPARILVTHGSPVLTDGRTALAAALDRDPWYGAQ